MSTSTPTSEVDPRTGPGDGPGRAGKSVGRVAGRATWRSGSVIVWAAVLVVLAVLSGALVGRVTAPDVRPPDNAVDLGFSRDMKTHHAQGVEMALIEYGRTGDGSLRYLGYDIATGQQAQLGIMSGWLTLWGATQSSSGPMMAWMGQPHDGPMPGMATAEQVAALRTEPDDAAADEQFLRLMIRHHRGALPMAAYARHNASTPQLREFAATMEQTQSVEIDQMQELLVARGWAPEPEVGTRSPGTGSGSGSGSGHDQHGATG